MRLDPVRFRYRLQRNRPREVSLRGSVSCKSSSGWDPLGSSSNSVFQYPVFKVPRLVSEGVPRQAARMYITPVPGGCQRVFREIFSRPRRRPEGREKKKRDPEGSLSGAKAPRASATTLPSADYTAVRRAMAGLAAGFGMGPGDPRLRGRARAGRCPRVPGAPLGGALKAAWRF